MDITSVGLASARPNNVQAVLSQICDYSPVSVNVQYSIRARILFPYIAYTRDAFAELV